MMTTPENFKRRQLMEGAVLILLAIFTVVQSVYFTQQAGNQQDCIQRKFSELSVALDARSSLSNQETNQNKQLWLIYAHAAGLLKSGHTDKLKPKDQKALQAQLVDQLLEYKRVITKIEREREKHPVPPYPEGACNTTE